jgi:hypothetical protein
MRLTAGLPFCVALLTARGASTEVLMLNGDSSPRSSVPAAEVTVYLDAAEANCDYQRVALVESQEAERNPFDAGVSRIELIRAARDQAGKVGANALIVEQLGAQSAFTRQVTADSTGDRQRETRRSWGQGMFLAVYEDRPCSGTGRGKAKP